MYEAERNLMVRVKQEIEKRLRQLRVRVDMQDDDTVLLRNVPANDGFFSKARTNVLIKRARQGLPYLICVDEDLDYTGKDPALARAFVSGHKQQGWRVLSIGRSAGEDLQQVIEEALNVVGFDGREPEMKHAHVAEQRTPGSLLASFATSITTELNDEPTVGREEQIEEVVSSLLQWQVRLPMIVGESGVGKTNLARAAARRLKQLRAGLNVLSVDLGAVMAGSLFESEREALLIALTRDVADAREAIVVFEHLEMALLGLPRGHLLLAQAVDRGMRVIGTTLPGYQSRFEIEPLSRRVHVTELAEMGPADTVEVLRAVRKKIAEHHQMNISDSLIESVVETALPLEGCYPAKAITLLDAASARAMLAGETELTLFDLYGAASRFDVECSRG